MNPEYKNETTSKPVINTVLTEKAWKKVKIGAILLIASSVIGFLLLPAGYSYSEQTMNISSSALAAIYICSAILQLWLIVLGARLLKQAFAFRVLSSLKRRVLYLVPIVISMLFVTQWGKFANLVAFVLLMFACIDLKKAGVITDYKQ